MERERDMSTKQQITGLFYVDMHVIVTNMLTSIGRLVILIIVLFKNMHVFI